MPIDLPSSRAEATIPPATDISDRNPQSAPYSQRCLQLTLTADMLDAFCRRAGRQARRPADLIQALTAVQSFIAQCAPALQAPEGQPLRNCLETYLEAARAELLQQQAGQLRDAVDSRRIDQIGECYGHLSRSGFRQVAALSIASLDEQTLREVRAWLEDWRSQVNARARGNYPDTFNYAAAGIDPVTYLAVSDLHAVLSEL